MAQHPKSKTKTVKGNDLPKLAAPAQRALAAAGITRLEQLTRASRTELAKLHGMGPNALGKLEQAMAERGLEFADASASRQISDKANAKLPRCIPPKKK